jgi:hypothetical protein
MTPRIAHLADPDSTWLTRQVLSVEGSTGR